MTADTMRHGELADIHPFEPENLIDPWAINQRLRDEAPVFFDKATNLYVVTRYELVMEALRNPGTFSNNFGDFLTAVRRQPIPGAPKEVQDELDRCHARMLPTVDTLLTADPPKHGTYRSLVNRLFTASNVRKMEPYIQQIIDRTIESFVDEQGAIEFMDRFAFPVPLRIIADRLGVPPADRDFFYDGATAAAATGRMSVPGLDEAVRRARLIVELQNYMVALVEERRKNPLDDMCSILGTARLEDEDRPLNPAEIWNILDQFLVAGHETTTSTFGWGMLIWCRHPELQDRIRKDTDLVKKFVEETLRLESPAQGLPRVIKRETELGGQHLKPGDLVILRYGSANRDERHFECPAEVDLHRRNAGSHLGFGSGVHHCVGAPLARQELNHGFPSLLKRMGNFRLVPGRPAPEAEPSILFRNLPELWIEFDRL